MRQELNKDQEANRKFDARGIEQLARLVSVAYNSAILYGGSHPTTLKNTEPLHSLIVKMHDLAPTVSLIVNRDNLYIEETCVDRVINTKRLVQRFVKAGVESITFERGLTLRELQTAVRLTGDGREAVPLEKITEAFRSEGIKAVKLNFVHYRKITGDEEVVGKMEDMGQSRMPGENRPEGNTVLDRTTGAALRELENVFSLKRLLEQPSLAGAHIAQSLTSRPATDDAVDCLSQLRSEIRDLPRERIVPALDGMLSAIYELKVDFAEALAIRRAEGKLQANAEGVKTQLDDLTSDVICRLVIDEYRKGAVSVKRLAHIIRRMLPDFKELARFLPRLKDTLLLQGMPLSDYLQLIKELDSEMESEQLTRVLKEASEGIGLSVDEIVTEIKQDPDDAARLIVLASEIRKGPAGDQGQLSDLLTEYVERISTKMAVTSSEASGEDGGKQLRTIVARLQAQMMERMRRAGVDRGVLERVQQHLADRFPAAVTDASAQWMVNVVSTDREIPLPDIGKLLETLIEQESQLASVRDPLTNALLDKGYSPGQVEALFRRLSARVKSGKDYIPAGILSANNTLYFLSREIKQRNRYDSVFSVLLFSVGSIRAEGIERVPEAGEIPKMFASLFKLLRRMLRDLDLIGTLGRECENAIVIILTMTGAKGADNVYKRIMRIVPQAVIDLDSAKVNVDPCMAVICPESVPFKDMDSLLALIRKAYAQMGFGGPAA